MKKEKRRRTTSRSRRKRKNKEEQEEQEETEKRIWREKIMRRWRNIRTRGMRIWSKEEIGERK